VRGDERQPLLLEAFAVIAGGAARHRNRLGVEAAFSRRIFPTLHSLLTEKDVVLACSRVNGTPKARRSRSAQAGNERGYLVRRQPVQCAPQAVVVQVSGADPKPEQILNQPVHCERVQYEAAPLESKLLAVG
jgi:hypothetical protein